MPCKYLQIKSEILPCHHQRLSSAMPGSFIDHIAKDMRIST